MNKTAISFTTRDRVELSRQSIVPLLQPDKFDLFIVDGSKTEEGKTFPWSVHEVYNGLKHFNVYGGACRAIVYALTAMLKSENNYSHVGLCENDVLLAPDWFSPTMQLFARGEADGLRVGAVSARSYEDRVLIQRDGYALMSNLGAGMVIFTRQAAELILHTYRTHWSTENRRVFAMLTGIDIGEFWWCRTNEQFMCADHGWDRLLSSAGLASLALTPAACEMIGQDPPLEQQGLALVRAPVLARRADKAFDRYVSSTACIRAGVLDLPDNGAFYRDDMGSLTLYPHQVSALEDATYEGDWKLKWSQGFGPFAWEAGHRGPRDGFRSPRLTVSLSGPAEFLVSGGEHGGQVMLEDLRSGFSVKPMLPPAGGQGQRLFVQLQAPANVAYRQLRLTMLTPGTVFYGLRTREMQPMRPAWRFDDSQLPPV